MAPSVPDRQRIAGSDVAARMPHGDLFLELRQRMPPATSAGAPILAYACCRDLVFVAKLVT